ncbi:MAG TPA: hypothetical protein VKD22_03540 [Ramlibacter sp.]|nr:hypothetical protein [Ramlibacter sp.]
MTPEIVALGMLVAGLVCVAANELPDGAVCGAIDTRSACLSACCGWNLNTASCMAQDDCRAGACETHACSAYGAWIALGLVLAAAAGIAAILTVVLCRSGRCAGLWETPVAVAMHAVLARYRE